jgi:hypothetical protein
MESARGHGVGKTLAAREAVAVEVPVYDPWSSTAALVALAKGHPGQSRFGLPIVARLRLAPPPERPEVENQASHDCNDNDTDEHPTEHELIVARAHGRAKFRRRE